MGGQQKFTIGRDRNCDVPIADDSVSRLHAEIVLSEGSRILLTDCRSSNGTFLIRNGKKETVQQAYVAPGDTLQFGGVTMPVADLLDAIRNRQKRPEAAAAGKPTPAPRAEPAPTPPAEAAVKPLVRCVCGAVILKGGKCWICGA
ncbi:MAG: FHA domain-containing protein [Bryobacteraceae bacterium]|nr:FHA domain-containing protein [Bryobacteraceae bacterium]